VRTSWTVESRVSLQHLRPHRPCSFNLRDMASSHGVPRIAREGDGELEKEKIREYRALLDVIAAKVRHVHETTQHNITRILIYVV
jgi:hypothetical protein